MLGLTLGASLGFELGAVLGLTLGVALGFVLGSTDPFAYAPLTAKVISTVLFP